MTTETIEQKLLGVTKTFHPLEAMLEVTTACNASCAYCYMRQEPQHTDLSTSDMFRVIDKLDEAGIMFLGLSGGEPFIRKDILEILQYIFSKNIFKTTIISNGTLMNDEHVRFMLKHKLFFSIMRFSVFSHVREVHDAYVGVPGAYDTIIANALKLKAGGIPIIILLNVIQENLETFNESKKKFEAMGFIVLISFLKEINNRHLYSLLKAQSSEEFFVKAFMELDHKDRIAHKEDFQKRTALKEINPGLCNGLTASITVEADGMLIPCASFRRKKIGSILQGKSILQLLRESKDVCEIRSVDKSKLDGCKTCKYTNACDLCLGLSYSEHEDLYHRPEQFCNYINALRKTSDLL